VGVEISQIIARPVIVVPDMETSTLPSRQRHDGRKVHLNESKWMPCNLEFVCALKDLVIDHVNIKVDRLIGVNLGQFGHN
jgi:hypothetical protein